MLGPMRRAAATPGLGAADVVAASRLGEVAVVESVLA
jgi:hypothetical protein